MTDLWTAATLDVDEDQEQAVLAAARVAAADAWPFLAEAEHEGAFLNRTAVVAEHLDRVCSALADGAPFAILRARLEASLLEDFRTLAATRTASFYVHRQHPATGREGWVGPIRSENQAHKEKAAWEGSTRTHPETGDETPWQATVHPSTPEVKAKVSDWQKSVKERKSQGSIQAEAMGRFTHALPGQRKARQWSVDRTNRGTLLVQGGDCIGHFDPATGEGHFSTAGGYFHHLPLGKPRTFPQDFVDKAVAAAPERGSTTIIGTSVQRQAATDINGYVERIHPTEIKDGDMVMMQPHHHPFKASETKHYVAWTSVWPEGQHMDAPHATFNHDAPAYRLKAGTTASMQRRASIFSTPEEHAANPPETWEVHKAADRVWHLKPKGSSGIMDSFTTKGAAEKAKTEGFLHDLYHQEKHWYGGGSVPGWKSYEDTKKKSSLQVEAASWGRRHYEDLAAVLSKHGDAAAAKHFANHLASTNTAYHPEQFLRAAQAPNYKPRSSGTPVYTQSHYQHIAAGVSSFPGNKQALANTLASHLSNSAGKFDQKRFMKAAIGDTTKPPRPPKPAIASLPEPGSARYATDLSTAHEPAIPDNVGYDPREDCSSPQGCRYRDCPNCDPPDPPEDERSRWHQGARRTAAPLDPDMSAAPGQTGPDAGETDDEGAMDDANVTGFTPGMTVTVEYQMPDGTTGTCDAVVQTVNPDGSIAFTYDNGAFTVSDAGDGTYADAQGATFEITPADVDAAQDVTGGDPEDAPGGGKPPAKNKNPFGAQASRRQAAQDAANCGQCGGRIWRQGGERWRHSDEHLGEDLTHRPFPKGSPSLNEFGLYEPGVSRQASLAHGEEASLAHGEEASRDWHLRRRMAGNPFDGTDPANPFSSVGTPDPMGAPGADMPGAPPAPPPAGAAPMAAPGAAPPMAMPAAPATSPDGQGDPGMDDDGTSPKAKTMSLLVAHVRSTNPSISVQAARSLAAEALSRYPVLETVDA